MIWPKELKERVRERVNSRGLTDWVLDAVRARLDEVPDADMRELVQRMADSIALGGDYEDREMAIHMLDLPDWVDRSEWPWVKYAQQLVESEAAPDDEPETDAQPNPEPEPEPEPVEPEVAESGPDGEEVNLRILEQTAPLIDPTLTAPPLEDLVRGTEFEDALPAPAPAPVIQEPVEVLASCPVCNMPLIEGECWTCG